MFFNITFEYYIYKKINKLCKLGALFLLLFFADLPGAHVNGSGGGYIFGCFILTKIVNEISVRIYEIDNHRMVNLIHTIASLLVISYLT